MQMNTGIRYSVENVYPADSLLSRLHHFAYLRD